MFSHSSRRFRVCVGTFNRRGGQGFPAYCSHVPTSFLLYFRNIKYGYVSVYTLIYRTGSVVHFLVRTKWEQLKTALRAAPMLNLAVPTRSENKTGTKKKPLQDESGRGDRLKTS